MLFKAEMRVTRSRIEMTFAEKIVVRSFSK